MSEAYDFTPRVLSYGCAFCVTGKEETTALHIEKTCPGIRATPVRQVKRRTIGGYTSQTIQIAFPGYVFLEVEPPYDSIYRLPRGNIKLLTKENFRWMLSGDDERYARWVFSQNGLIAMSEACLEGDRVRIVRGPLKDLEGQILKIDKRNRNGQVMLTFNNRIVKAWLGFEFVEKERS